MDDIFETEDIVQREPSSWMNFRIPFDDRFEAELVAWLHRNTYPFDPPGDGDDDQCDQEPENIEQFKQILQNF